MRDGASVLLPAVPYDDDPDDDLAGSGPLLPPEDRLWRHPSELHLLATPTPPPPGRPASPSSPWAVAVGAAAVGALVAVAAVALLSDGPGVRIVQREVVQQVAVTTADLGAFGVTSGVAAVAEQIAPAVARVEVPDGDGGSRSASGVVFRDDGYLLTSALVVGTAGEVAVVLAGDVLAGEVVGADPETDVAVVRVDGAGLPTAVLGTAAGLRVGQPVVAVGSPRGLRGGPSVTTGIVSGVQRRIDRDGGPALHGMVETDAPVHAGSAGGAVVDASGAVVGIVAGVAGDGTGPGLAVAVPIDVARAVAADIVADGHAHHVWLGIEGVDMTAAAAEERGVDGGALVEGVVDGSPADDAGLAGGDVIVAVDGRPVASMSALVVALRGHDPGDDVELRCVRDGDDMVVTVTLVEKPDPDE